ncbi:DUF554 domain-containing protein [Oscillospiraceae bacterium LTW-04]|nr:DUF554 domain-containing protein [Oscillospiraceae bacterium MB24-C1]
MTGTIVNAAAIAAGAAIGLLFKKGLPKRIEENALKFVGTGVAILGLNGVICAMITADTATGLLSYEGGILLVLSLAAGGIIGELFCIEDKLYAGGVTIEKKLGAQGFAKGFVSASMLFCIGAMAIVGALSDGLNQDSSILFVKATLDGITSIVLAAALGYGVLFSALAVLVYQGLITLCAGLLAPVLDGTELLNQICMVGYCIVLLIGTNMLGSTKVKTANLLPAMLGPVMYNFIMMLKNT